MVIRFIADENIPFQVVEALRQASYKFTTVSEVAHPSMKNEELAKLSIQLGMVIITRDADFAHLKRPLMRQLKVVYIRLSGDPDSIAQHILDNIGRFTTKPSKGHEKTVKILNEIIARMQKTTNPILTG